MLIIIFIVLMKFFNHIKKSSKNKIYLLETSLPKIHSSDIAKDFVQEILLLITKEPNSFS